MAAERFLRGPVDREDGLAKTSLSISFSLRGLFGCRSLPLDVTYITLYSVFIFVLGVYQYTASHKDIVT